MLRELRVVICFSLLRSCPSSTTGALVISVPRVFEARRRLFSVHVARCSLRLESINLFLISTVIGRVSASRHHPLLTRKENSGFHPIRDFIGPQQFWTWCWTVSLPPSKIEPRTWWWIESSLYLLYIEPRTRWCCETYLPLSRIEPRAWWWRETYLPLSKFDARYGDVTLFECVMHIRAERNRTQVNEVWPHDGDSRNVFASVNSHETV